ncbi:hypothetical protein PO124_26390 [Bacillus licheniformis]|nr:hypothetical protein [Bacillus licheniformis]
MFNRVDGELAKQIAAGVGVEPLKRRRLQRDVQIPCAQPGEYGETAADKDSRHLAEQGLMMKT